MTACGLALPPDDFITWPTNQPIAFGLDLGIGDLVRVLGDDFVDDLLDCAEVGDLFHPALFDDRARIAAFGPDDLEQILGDFSGNCAVGDQIEHGAKLRGLTGEDAMSPPSLFSRPNNSLITQFAANLASRPLATASK